MKRALLIALAVAAGAAFADSNPRGYRLSSPDTPDPMFVTSGVSVPISVTAFNFAIRGEEVQ